MTVVPLLTFLAASTDWFLNKQDLALRGNAWLPNLTNLTAPKA